MMQHQLRIPIHERMIVMNLFLLRSQS